MSQPSVRGIRTLLNRQGLLLALSAAAAGAYLHSRFEHAHNAAELAALRSHLTSSGGETHQTCFNAATALPLPPVDRQWVSRLLSAALFLGIIVAGTWTWRNVDSLHQVFRLSGQPEDSSSVSLSKLIAYRIDVWFTINPYSKVLALLYLTMALVFMGALGIKSVNQQTFYTAIWDAIAGVGIDWTFASHEEDTGFLARITALLIAVGGLCITALMLGIVSEQVGQKLEDVQKKGRSEVLERGHTLILGWSDKMIAIVDQLCNANESEGGRPIVILAEMEKEEMEHELGTHGIDFRGSHIVCRRGNPMLESDLKRVSLAHARAIVVLSTCEVADQADARVLRTVLGLMGEHDRVLRAGGSGLRGHIVAEMADIDNEPLVRIVGGERLFTVNSHDIIGRLMIQCARQPGLAAVWEGIMGFVGNEFYFKRWPELDGRRFGDALLMFEDAVPLGVKLAGQHATTVCLNPSDDYELQPGDELLVLAEDDDTYQPSAAPAQCRSGSLPQWTSRTEPERLLFVGWRRDLDDLIVVLDSFVPPGSELHLYNDVPVEDRDRILLHGGLDVSDLQNLTLVYKDRLMQGDMVDRKRLEELSPEQFNSILILSDCDRLGTVDSDSRCIAVSLLLRDIQASRAMSAALVGKAAQGGGRGSARTASGNTSKEDLMTVEMADLQAVTQLRSSGASGSFTSSRSGLGGGKTRLQPSASLLKRLRQGGDQTVIISEILESRAKRIVSELGICEFILSNELVSMALAMVAESPAVISVLAELFTEEGNELVVHPAGRYLHANEQISFYDVLRRSRQKAEIVIGYQERSSGRIVLNPSGKGKPGLSRDAVSSFVVLSESSV